MLSAGVLVAAAVFTGSVCARSRSYGVSTLWAFAAGILVAPADGGRHGRGAW
jgi:hypothetical protein